MSDLQIGYPEYRLKHFGTSKCRICNRIISINGMAQWSHRMKHVREGKLRLYMGGFKEPDPSPSLGGQSPSLGAQGKAT